jgi:cellulose synthase/poly-beta-1,6-N-acetylglucosamine synthase-like glycosyltransferase
LIFIYIKINKLFLFKKNHKNFQKISLLIAFHNEESRIVPCIESLLKLDYPEDFYEIIWVNDRSTDKSSEIIKSRQCKNWKIIDIYETPEGFSAKKWAIQEAIMVAKFDILAFTDADCIVPKDHLRNVSISMEDNDVALGMAPLISKNQNFLFFFQEVESFLNHVFMILSLSLHRPMIVFGRNWAYTKEAFFKVRGFASISQMLSGDDDLLLQKFRKENLRFSIIKKSIVSSPSVEDYQALMRQKKRHLSVINMISIKEILLISTFHIFLIAFLLYLILNPLLMLLKILIDTLFIGIVSRFLYDISSLRISLLANFAYYPLIIWILLKSLVSKSKLTWK